MIDGMRFFENPYGAISIVRKFSHIETEEEDFAHVVCRDRLTIMMFASLIIQLSLEAFRLSSR